MFLTPDEVAELTGYKRGRDGKSRDQLQCEYLRRMGIAFYPNAAGQPKIARAFIEGGAKSAEKKQTSWEPSLLSF